MSDQKPQIVPQNNQADMTWKNLTMDLSFFSSDNKKSETVNQKNIVEPTKNLPNESDKVKKNEPNISLDKLQIDKVEEIKPKTQTLNLNKLILDPWQSNIQNPVVQNDFNVPQTSSPIPESILWKINKDDQNVVKKNTINLDSISIAKNEIDQNKIVLWDWWFLKNIWDKREINYLKILIICSILIFICWFFALVFYFYNKYLTIYSQNSFDTTNNIYLEKVRKYENTLSNYIKLDNYSNYSSVSFFGSDASSQFNNLLNATDLNYIHKKDIIQNNLSSVSQNIVKTYKNIENLKQDISEHGFFPQELADVLWTWEQIVSIKRSLLSLETIKFLSAIKVFSYLDSFLYWATDYMKLSKEFIQKTLEDYNKMWEKDISLYLSYCYLNPYEVDYDCKNIWDFDFYFNNIKDKSDSSKMVIDTNFFKKLIYYIDLKLEQTTLPSFSIIFQWFDPTKQTITFNIDVNTFQQDETALLKNWIMNPHIFVVTNLLNLFRQSTFIVGNTIDAKNLKIKQKSIMIWSTEFVVNNSFMSFTLPIQKYTEREITDYTD